jgi:hypothetical protein
LAAGVNLSIGAAELADDEITANGRFLTQTSMPKHTEAISAAGCAFVSKLYISVR